MQLTQRESVLGARVNNREIELLVVRLQLDKEIEHHVEHFVRASVLAVDFVDDNNRLGLVLERLSQHKPGLSLRSIVRVYYEQNSIDHLHDALDLAAKIRVARRIDDIDPITVPLKRSVLRANGDPFLAFEIHGIHHPLLGLLVGAESSGLTQQLIDKRGLAVIDVRNNGDVTNFIHSRDLTL